MQRFFHQIVSWFINLPKIVLCRVLCNFRLYFKAIIVNKINLNLDGLLMLSRSTRYNQVKMPCFFWLFKNREFNKFWCHKLLTSTYELWGQVGLLKEVYTTKHFLSIKLFIKNNQKDDLPFPPGCLNVTQT